MAAMGAMAAVELGLGGQVMAVMEARGSSNAGSRGHRRKDKRYPLWGQWRSMLHIHRS